MSISVGSGEHLSINMNKATGGVLKDEFGGTGVSSPGAEGHVLQSVGGEFATRRGLYCFSATSVDLAVANTKSLFTTPANTVFVPTEYSIYVDSASAVVDSASAVFSLSGTRTLDANNFVNPLSGTFLNKSISSATAVPASTTIKLVVSTAVNAASITGSVYLFGYFV